jgi:hypothetical protein
MPFLAILSTQENLCTEAAIEDRSKNSMANVNEKVEWYKDSHGNFTWL